MSKVLSVVIPSYNASAFLKEDIPSFLDERILDDIELIIVNDGSKDDTLETARKFCAEYPNSILCIDKDNGGHGSTINAGVKKASGKYFKVVDADDWVDTTAFVEFVEYLKTVDTDLVIAPYTAVYMDTNKQTINCRYNLEKGKTYTFDRICKELNTYAMHAVTYLTSVIRKQRAISEHCFYVDMEYICNPVKDINTVSYFDKSVYQYRLGNVEQSVSIKSRQKNKDMQKRVTLNVLELLDDSMLSLEKKEFLEKMIGALIVNQTDILLSFSPSPMIKKELFDFYSGIRNHNGNILDKVNGKKVRLLNKYGERIYRPLAILVRLTKTYH